MTFVDLTKAFDTVSRDGLWKLMAKFVCPTRFIVIVQLFHDGMLTRVQNDVEYKWSQQGCVPSPTLFSMMLSAMLKHAFRDCDTGLQIRYRFDDMLFKLRRLHAKSKIHTYMLDGLLHADDMAKNASTERKMQEATDRNLQVCDNYDLAIGKKNEIMY